MSKSLSNNLYVQIRKLKCLLQCSIQTIKSININHKGREQKTNVNEEKEMRSGREKKLKWYREGRNRREIWGETAD